MAVARRVRRIVPSGRRWRARARRRRRTIEGHLTACIVRRRRSTDDALSRRLPRSASSSVRRFARSPACDVGNDRRRGWLQRPADSGPHASFTRPLLDGALQAMRRGSQPAECQRSCCCRLASSASAVLRPAPSRLRAEARGERRRRRLAARRHRACATAAGDVDRRAERCAFRASPRGGAWRRIGGATTGCTKSSGSTRCRPRRRRHRAARRLAAA